MGTVTIKYVELETLEGEPTGKKRFKPFIEVSEFERGLQAESEADRHGGF